MKPMWIFVIGFVLLAVFTAVVMSRTRHIIHGAVHRPSHRPSHIPGMPWHPIHGSHLLGENFTTDATFYMFGVDWCPHCTSTKPEFEKLGSTQTIGGKTVRCVYVNPEKEPEAAKGFAVDGYPTLILQKSDGTQVKHSGPRTQAGFLEFLRGTV